MGAFANVLAAGPHPTTEWKSPLDLQQQESTVLHNRASAKSIEQETMMKRAEAARAEALRKATMKAAKEAGQDPQKFVSIYLGETGDQEGANKFQQSFDAHRTSLLTADEKTRAAQIAANSRTAAALESVLSQKDPVAQARARSMANAQLQREGLPPLPDAPIEDLGTLRDLVGLEGGIMTRATAQAEEERKKADQAIQQAAEARAAAAAPVDLQIKKNTAITGAPNEAGLTPEQEQAKKDRATTNLQREYEYAKSLGFKGTPADWAVLRPPQVQVNVDGKPLPQTAIKSLETIKGHVDQLESLVDGFQDDFGGNKIGGSIENWLGGMGGESIGLATKGQSDWWSAYQAHKNEIRHGLFGSALSANEKGEWDKQDITPNMAPDKIRENLQRQAEIESRALARLGRVYEKGGFNKDQLGEYAPTRKDSAGVEVPEAVTTVLKQAAPGEHKLSDGSTWVKSADGKITKK